MNFGFWNFYPYYNRNRMFTQAESEIGDDLAYSMVHLGQRLRDLGHNAATLDMQPVEWFDRIFFIDNPTLLQPRFRELRRRNHPDVNLIASESMLIRPDNHKPEVQARFRRVMTWRKDLCARDPQKFVHFCLANKLHLPERRVPFAQRKLCVMINRYMTSSGPNELYSERVRAIRWFENNAPQDFDLWGKDWDRPLFPGPLSPGNLPLRLAYNRIPVFKNFRLRQFPSFKGPAKSKRAVVEQYKFSLAYENCAEPDYLSEKLFDCFFAGSVPIYLGAPNVLDYVPADTFIDKRKFASYDELYKFISAMTEAEHARYLDAALAFLQSPAMRPFTAEGFADIFVANFAS